MNYNLKERGKKKWQKIWNGILTIMILKERKKD